MTGARLALIWRMVGEISLLKMGAREYYWGMVFDL